MNHINIQKVQKQLPIFTIDISNHIDALNLAKQAIFEEHSKNPISIESNVKASYVSSWVSHQSNTKFEPLSKLIVSATEFVSKEYFDRETHYKITHMWGMLYDKGDFTIKHTHFPSVFACAIYIDVEPNCAPIIFEDTLTINPSSSTMVLFPALLEHEVPVTTGRRIVISANIDVKGE